MRDYRNARFDEVHNAKTIGTFEGTMMEGLSMSLVDMKIDDMMDQSKVNGFLSVYLNMLEKLDEIDHLAIPPKSLFNNREKSYRMDRPITLTGDPHYIEEEIQFMKFAVRSVSLTLRGKGRRFYDRRQTSWIKASMKWYMVYVVAVYYNSYAQYSDYLAYLCGQIIGKYMKEKEERKRSYKKKVAPKQEHVQLRVPAHLAPVQDASVQEQDKLRYHYGVINE